MFINKLMPTMKILNKKMKSWANNISGWIATAKLKILQCSIFIGGNSKTGFNILYTQARKCLENWTITMI